MNTTPESGRPDARQYLYAIAALVEDRACEVANLKCPVARNGQRQLEDAVFQAAGLFDNNYAFDLNGPWAPHNFVEMDLKLNGLK